MRLGHLIMSAAVFMVAACTTAQQEPEPSYKHLTIAVEGSFPPFNSVSEDGRFQGFDVEIARALCQQMQRSCDFVKENWESMMQDLIDKKFDVIVSSMDITEERANLVAFSNSYYAVPTILAARKDAKIKLGEDGNPTSSSFDGLRVGVIKDLRAESFARVHFKGATIVTYESVSNARQALLNREIDAWFDNRLILNGELFGHDDTKDMVIVGKGYVGGELGNGEGIALRKQDRRLANDINVALKAIQDNGTYQKINAEYFDFDIYPHFAP